MWNVYVCNHVIVNEVNGQGSELYTHYRLRAIMCMNIYWKNDLLLFESGVI